jgi:hypothetical protein
VLKSSSNSAGTGPARALVNTKAIRSTSVRYAILRRCVGSYLQGPLRLTFQSLKARRESSKVSHRGLPVMETKESTIRITAGLGVESVWADDLAMILVGT